MSSYFYHLTFELYPYPLLNDISGPENWNNSQSRTAFTPPAGTNIFTDSLPVRSASLWTTVNPIKTSIRRTRTASARYNTISDVHDNIGPKLRRRLSGATSFNDTILNRTCCLPRDLRESKQRHSVCSRDWRYGPISVDSIDMEAPSEFPADEAERGTQEKVHRRDTANGLSTKARFIPSDPKNTDLGWGVVHLYRDGRKTSTTHGDLCSLAGPDSAQDDAEREKFDEANCTTLCILAVPSYMMPSDLLGFLGEQTREDVSHFRLIRTGRKNQYMVLMKFREARNARHWRQTWNGKLFNSMEPENCHVVFVKSIKFQTPADVSPDPTSFPLNTNDPFNPTVQSYTGAIHPNSNTTQGTAGVNPSLNTAKSLTTKPPPPPTASLVELPTCPVCLERMDETTGLLTILCQHVFHCSCLIKWTGSGCPVCRYTQSGSPNLGLRGPGYPGDEEKECSVCGATSNLWICLICGNAGCGRYDDAHAFAHYEASGHCFAMDVATQHVWDYAGDGYVHRLIQNKADGKLVELPAAFASALGEQEGMTGAGEPAISREKFENMGLEYTYLLTSQLESQRVYYEEQLERAVDKATRASSAAERAEEILKQAMEKLFVLQTSHDQLVGETVPSTERERQRLEKRAEKFETLSRNISRQFQEEKTVSESLMERVKHLDGQVTELRDKNADLVEQNRDLSCFISGVDKVKELEEQGEKVIDGTVGVVATKKKKGRGNERK